MLSFTECVVELAALARLEGLGGAGVDGPNVAPEAAAWQLTRRHV